MWEISEIPAMNKEILNLITFASAFHPQNERAIRESHRALFEELDSEFSVRLIFHSELQEFLSENRGTERIMTFIATGGTEGMVVRNYDLLPHPIVLLTDGEANSLAASLELACWVRQRGDECRIVHSKGTAIPTGIVGRKTFNEGHPQPLKGERIGVIGKPSDWLVSSNVDYAEAYRHWGVEYVDIALSRIENYYKETTNADESIAESFVNGADGCIEPNRKEIEKAVRLYQVLKRIAEEERLTALTIQCFSLIPTTGTTGCLALALLNDEGIISGCEGDLQSIFTMLLAKRATNSPGFMANPSHIDREKNSIILSHCTIGLQQTERYIIRSHFESQSGVAIQGIMPTGDVTIVKCGGNGLEEYVILTGKITENQDDPKKCRTQVLIRLDDNSPADYFLTENIGNHHIIILGNHRKEIEGIISDNPA